MKKRELIQLMVGLSYSTGYDHARNEQEVQHKHELALRSNYEIGRIDEREYMVQLLESNHEPTKGDKTHNQSAKCFACKALLLIKGEQK